MSLHSAFVLEGVIIVVGLLLALIGKVLSKWHEGSAALGQVERASMERHGQLPGDEAYMRDFRVAQAEGDVLDDQRAERRWKRATRAGLMLAALASLALLLTICLWYGSVPHLGP